MDSHDIGRDRGGIEDALLRVKARTLVVGIDTDRLFPLEGQRRIARGIPTTIHGDEPVIITSDFGHDRVPRRRPTCSATTCERCSPNSS